MMHCGNKKGGLFSSDIFRTVLWFNGLIHRFKMIFADERQYVPSAVFTADRRRDLVGVRSRHDEHFDDLPRVQLRRGDDRERARRRIMPLLEVRRVDDA